MSMRKSTSDFKTMNVAELKKYLQDRGVSVSGYLTRGNRFSSQRNGFTGSPKL